MILTNFAVLDLSTPDLVIILAIVLLLFGSKKLPELSKSLGRSAGELRAGFSDIQKAHGELKDQAKQVKVDVTRSSGKQSDDRQPNIRPVIQ